MAGQIDLTGSTAIVTGSGRGIGREIALAFADRGANVVVTARTASEVEATAAAVADRGVESLAVSADLRELDDIERIVEEAVGAFGVPEILVNNAAANLPARPLDQTVEEVDTMLAVNFRAPFLLTKRWAGAFRASDHDDGRVINISSMTGKIGVPAMTLYGGTNAGLCGMTRGFAAALAPDDVTVNSVSPGLIGIDRIKKLVEERGEEIYDFDRLPLGRLGDASEIADACLYLASDGASYVTGIDIPVDGGVGFTAGLYKP